MNGPKTYLLGAVAALLALFASAPAVVAQAVQDAPPPAQQADGAPIGPATAGDSLARFAGVPGAGGVALNQLSAAGTPVHILPTRAKAAARAAALKGFAPPPLVYHTGGSVMTPYVYIYTIYWNPPKLQTGAATGFTANYMAINNHQAGYYQGHGLGNINTQYYQVIGSTKYIQNLGGYGGTYVDTDPYPASGCTDTITPGNCLTNAQIVAEIKKVMALKGWPGGLNRLYLLFTSKGEGSCVGTACAYTEYCAYHSYFAANGQYVIYGNEPYGLTAYCQDANVPSPNNDPEADTAATAASHEISEAITDPLLNAWFDSSGAENGDKCAYDYGTNSWNKGTANQMWNGYFFELQQEWNRHTASCTQNGP
jgi:hypothetical protein